jgi:hypothetical protein
MSVRRGLFRIWILAAATWLVYWSASLWESCVPEALEDKGYLACRRGLVEWVFNLGEFSLSSYLELALYGLGIPFLILMFGCGVAWALDGFQESQNARR